MRTRWEVRGPEPPEDALSEQRIDRAQGLLQRHASGIRLMQQEVIHLPSE